MTGLFCQIQYNFMDEDFQAGRVGLEYAASKGLGVVIMEPLRGGGLTARIPAEVRAVWDKAQVKRTPAEWALRFVWNRPEASVVLSGMSELRQLEENIDTLAEDWPTRLRQANWNSSRSQGHLPVSYPCPLHQLRLLLPCPASVQIPANFQQLNNLAVYQDRNFAEFFIIMFSPPSSGPLTARNAASAKTPVRSTSRFGRS